jgi:GNAT superfamily N-acetyltransferase
MITFEWSDWRCADVWWIQSVYVHPDHRRQGLFRALYQHAKQKSQDSGACGLRLYADVENAKAQETVRAQRSASSC